MATNVLVAVGGSSRSIQRRPFAPPLVVIHPPAARALTTLGGHGTLEVSCNGDREVVLMNRSTNIRVLQGRWQVDS
jgi:hypothetical protein